MEYKGKLEHDTIEGYRIRITGVEFRNGVYYTQFRRLDTFEFGEIVSQNLARFIKRHEPKAVVVAQPIAPVWQAKMF